MGGGGPAKAAQPTVTPFVEPAAPQNPIPNWFQGNSGATGKTSFTPDFSGSKSSFSTPQAQIPAAPVSTSGYSQPPAASPASPPMNYTAGPATSTPVGSMPQQQFMPFNIPTFSQNKPWWAPQDMWANFGKMTQGFNNWFNQPAPTYTNYTDTTPQEHTTAPVQPWTAGLLNPFGGQ